MVGELCVFTPSKPHERMKIHTRESTSSASLLLQPFSLDDTKQAMSSSPRLLRRRRRQYSQNESFLDAPLHLLQRKLPYFCFFLVIVMTFATTTTKTTAAATATTTTTTRTRFLPDVPACAFAWQGHYRHKILRFSERRQQLCRLRRPLSFLSATKSSLLRTKTTTATTLTFPQTICKTPSTALASLSSTTLLLSRKNTDAVNEADPVNSPSKTSSPLQPQQKQKQQQQQQHLVLIGGGHAHAQVIKALNEGARPSHLKVTLIDAQAAATYSGMVPGAIAGSYAIDQTLLPLAPLAEWAGVNFLQDRAVDIDLDQKVVYLQHHEPPLSFDCISIDIGSASRDLDMIPGASKYTIPTRPIDQLVQKLQRAIDEDDDYYSDDNDDCDYDVSLSSPHLVVVGGGVAGMELSMAAMSRWNNKLQQKQQQENPVKAKVQCTILNAGEELLPGESSAARDKLTELLTSKGIQVLYNCKVQQVTEHCVHFTQTEESTTSHEQQSTQQALSFTYCIWATGAGAHPLARHLRDVRGLDVTKYGWITVNTFLQSTSHPFVFAAGDCAAVQAPGIRSRDSGLPKAGVYAVRAGPVLIENLTRFLENERRLQQQMKLLLPNEKNDTEQSEQPLLEYQPQSDFLKLLVCGDEKALGLRFGLVLYGKWVWQLKDHIDQQFMRLFNVNLLPPKPQRVVPTNDTEEPMSSSYDTSQYDAVDDKGPATLPPLDPAAAVILLQRSDDHVDYQLAWKILRRMAQDPTYCDQVLLYAKAASNNTMAGKADPLSMTANQQIKA